MSITPSTDLLLIEGREFSNEVIVLDFHRFENCGFLNCQIVYHGYSVGSLVSCRFENCDFGFNGPASNVAEYLRALYKHGGDMKNIAESFIQDIKGAQH